MTMIREEIAADIPAREHLLDACFGEARFTKTCERLRGMPGFENAPILMLTGLDDEASIKRAYDAGATDFFVKSNQWSLLAGRLRHMLRAARTQQELIRSRAKAILWRAVLRDMDEAKLCEEEESLALAALQRKESSRITNRASAWGY